jgi:hypothetical protein
VNNMSGSSPMSPVAATGGQQSLAFFALCVPRTSSGVLRVRRQYW